MENTEKTLVDLKEALQRLDNDMSLFNTLADMFLQDASCTPEKIRELEQTARNKNPQAMEEAGKCIHRLKGAARQLSANPLAEKARQLEDIFRQKAEGDTSVLTEELIDLYESTVSFLRNLQKA